jgi:hypothetical protein
MRRVAHESGTTVVISFGSHLKLILNAIGEGREKSSERLFIKVDAYQDGFATGRWKVKFRSR